METPASILNQILIDNLTDAEYTLLPCKNKLFHYRCEVKGHIEEGSGQSKKKAKQSAAKKMVLHLIENPKFIITANRDDIHSNLNRFDDFGTLIESKEIKPVPIQSSTDISDLQTLCNRKRWDPPVYNELETRGLPHDRVFTIECFLKNMNLTAQGTGKSKQAAKHDAATKMMTILKNENLDKSDEILDNYGKRNRIYQNTAKTTFDIPKAINDFLNNCEKDRFKATNVFKFFEKITSNSDKMEMIKKLIPNGIYYIQDFFAETADFNNIEKLAKKLTDILDCKFMTSCLPDKSAVGQFQYLAELIATDESFGTSPLITVWGVDDDLINARIKSIGYLILLIVFYISINDKSINNENMEKNSTLSN